MKDVRVKPLPDGSCIVEMAVPPAVRDMWERVVELLRSQVRPDLTESEVLEIVMSRNPRRTARDLGVKGRPPRRKSTP